MGVSGWHSWPGPGTHLPPLCVSLNPCSSYLNPPSFIDKMIVSYTAKWLPLSFALSYLWFARQLDHLDLNSGISLIRLAKTIGHNFPCIPQPISFLLNKEAGSTRVRGNSDKLLRKKHRRRPGGRSYNRS